MPRLTKKQKAAIDYFDLDYAKSDETGAGWFVYTKSVSHPFYPGSSCECLEDAENWYCVRLESAKDWFIQSYPSEKAVSDKILLALYDFSQIGKHTEDIAFNTECNIRNIIVRLTKDNDIELQTAISLLDDVTTNLRNFRFFLTTTK